MSFLQFDWLSDSYYDVILTTLRGEYNIFVAWLLSTPALPSRQVNMADSWWMNFSPIWKTLKVQDIWKDGEYFKWLLSSLHRKSFQQLVFMAVNNSKRSGYVDWQRGGVGSTDPSMFFSKLKLLILRQWWQLWMKSAIKQRYRVNLFFVVFCLIVLLHAELDE